MSITIIMSMNIYITKTNEEKLRQLDGLTMSGLINHLLMGYFKQHSVDSIKKKLEPSLRAIAAKNPAAAEVVRRPGDFELVDEHYEETVGASVSGSNSTLGRQPVEQQPTTCKNGHLLANGKCLQKDCKYS